MRISVPIRRIFVGRISGVLFATAVLGATERGLAQDTGRLRVTVSTNEETLVGVPVMFSCISDGEIVFQKEALTNIFGENGGRCVSQGMTEDILVGAYDVRFEGSGMVTEVKRGVQVLAGRTTDLRAVMRPGEGVHIVEYAIGGLAREEVAQRLRALEASVSELEERMNESERSQP